MWMIYQFGKLHMYYNKKQSDELFKDPVVKTHIHVLKLQCKWLKSSCVESVLFIQSQITCLNLNVTVEVDNTWQSYFCGQFANEL